MIGNFYLFTTVSIMCFVTQQNTRFLHTSRVLRFQEAESLLCYFVFRSWPHWGSRSCTYRLLKYEFRTDRVPQMAMSDAAFKDYIILIYLNNLRNVRRIFFFLRILSLLKEVLSSQANWPNSAPSAETWTFLLQIEPFFHQEIQALSILKRGLFKNNLIDSTKYLKFLFVYFSLCET